ncbi:hypothetical protein DFH27DRAFT_235508 [Peziza echinospora]|nr:hypothetical protein DFH27DRAFT_235508 [Peziza echinospora]
MMMMRRLCFFPCISLFPLSTYILVVDSIHARISRLHPLIQSDLSIQFHVFFFVHSSLILSSSFFLGPFYIDQDCFCFSFYFPRFFHHD